jgi:DNA invertase Pin-like site-specific DNA recombinase
MNPSRQLSDTGHSYSSHKRSGNRDASTPPSKLREPGAADVSRGLPGLSGSFETGPVATIGYARVSTSDQNPEVQAARLREHGCEKVFADHGVSGRLASRPQWDACRAFLRSGDVLVVTKLDRIGRSVRNLIEVVGDLERRGVDLVVLDQAINISTPAGRMLFHVLAAISEFERDLANERTRDGLAAAKVRHGGKLPPRGPSISPDKLAVARHLYEQGDMPARRIA